MVTRGRLLSVAFVVVTALLAAALSVWVSLTWQPFVMLGALAVTAGQVVLLRRLTGSTLPFAAIPMVTFNMVGVAGYLYYRSLSGVGQFSLPVGDREFVAAAEIFALASFSITVGAFLGSVRKRRPSTAVPIPAGLPHLPTGALVVAAIVPLVLTVLGTGPAEILDRANYLYDAGPQWMVTISGVLVPLGVAASALLLFGRGARVGRIFGGLLLVAYVAVLLAKDTRLLGVVPLIVLALYVAQRGANPQRLIPATLAAIACSFVLLQVPLELRGLVPDAGLTPYVSALVNDPGDVFGGSAGNAIDDVLFSVPLTGYVATDVPSVPKGALLTSLSPLPGSMTSWPVIAPLLRVDSFVPFSSLGELAVQGALISFLYFAVLGYGVTRLQSVAGKLPGWRALAMLLALGGFTAALSLSALEYNLRSTTRYVWYALGLYLMLRFVPVLKRAPALRHRRQVLISRRPPSSEPGSPQTSRRPLS